MENELWRIQCAICLMWFLICRRDFRNHKYCGPECCRAARRKANREAQTVYVSKPIGKERRAVAAAAFRRRRKERLSPQPPLEESNRADYPAIQFPVTRSCPSHGRCAICGFAGPVKAHSP